MDYTVKMTSEMDTNEALLQAYVPRILPLLELAKKAYGSRDTISPQHDASREYTRLLCEYYGCGGSLLKMAEALDVTYAGLRRRVTTASLPASQHRPRKKFPDEVYDLAVADILTCKEYSTKEYHRCLKKHYDAGLSLARIATLMELSSANPLYYAVGRVALEEQDGQAED